MSAGWLEVTGAPVPSGHLYAEPFRDHVELTVGEASIRLDRTGVREVVDGLSKWLAEDEPPYQVGRAVMVTEGSTAGERRGDVVAVQRAPIAGAWWDVVVGFSDGAQMLVRVGPSGVGAGIVSGVSQGVQIRPLLPTATPPSVDDLREENDLLREALRLCVLAISFYGPGVCEPEERAMAAAELTGRQLLGGGHSLTHSGERPVWQLAADLRTRIARRQERKAQA